MVMLAFGVLVFGTASLTSLLLDQASHFRQLYTVFRFCSIFVQFGLNLGTYIHFVLPLLYHDGDPSLLLTRLATPLLTRQPPPSLWHSKTWLEALAQVSGTQGGLRGFFLGARGVKCCQKWTRRRRRMLQPLLLLLLLSSTTSSSSSARGDGSTDPYTSTSSTPSCWSLCLLAVLGSGCALR
jgi:hypothetical protein